MSVYALSLPFVDEASGEKYRQELFFESDVCPSKTKIINYMKKMKKEYPSEASFWDSGLSAINNAESWPTLGIDTPWKSVRTKLNPESPNWDSMISLHKISYIVKL